MGAQPLEDGFQVDEAPPRSKVHFLGTFRASEAVAPSPSEIPKPLSALPLNGKVVELSGGRGSARRSTAVSLLRAAQQEGETAAWIQVAHGPLYPPDLVDAGIQLEALIVVHVPRDAGSHGLPKAAEILLRSGGFGFVVLDLTESVPKADLAWLRRLASLAREHDAQLLVLTEKTTAASSLGSLVSLRVEPRRTRVTAGRFEVAPEVLRNKQVLFHPLAPLAYRGPWGLE